MNRLRTPHDVEVEEPIVRHAETDRPALEEFFDAAAITLQIVPLFRFASVLTRILPSSICSIIGTEWCYVS